MSGLASRLAPELVLTGIACVLFLTGCSRAVAARRAAAWVALLGIVGALAAEIYLGPEGAVLEHSTGSVRLDSLSSYIIVITCIVGVLLLLLSWPTDHEQTGNSGMRFGEDAGEYFGLFILSLAGLMLVAVANDLIILFLSLELVSIPTYIMVSTSRPSAVAQEAGLKYFFLGALSIALMLFGFSYLYGATGAVTFQSITAVLRKGLSADEAPALASWAKLGLVLVLLGFAYKMAAFPLHFYAGDVYEGAGTPVTAFLAFVPKAAGFVAMVRMLSLVGGEQFALPDWLVRLLWIMAALTMCVGNVLGLLQNNVKRVLAYSSIAHSGYMLVAVTALCSSSADRSAQALQGVLFYLAAYGVMNSGAFGVLMLLPSRQGSGSAETFDEIAGQGRRHVLLGLAMAIACFSLIGIPLTVGFIGKVLLIQPGWQSDNKWLVIILVVNAAVSAAYYLRIVGAMFLRPHGALMSVDEGLEADPNAPWRQRPVAGGVIMSAVLTLGFGLIPPATQMFADYARQGATLEMSSEGEVQPATRTPGPAAGKPAPKP